MFLKKNLKENIFLKPWTLFLLTALTNILIYLFFAKDINIVCRYLDGPHYLEVAKTFYQGITSNNPARLPEWYFAVHLPGFPIFIRLFLLFLPSCLAMLSAVTFLSSLGVLLFYLLLKEGKYVKNPFWLSIVFIFFTPRWLLYHTVAGSEPAFLVFTFLSLLGYKKKNVWLTVLGAWGAVLTRIFGILFFPLYFILYLKDKNKKGLFSSFLIPVPLLALFTYYYFRFADFFTYFHWNTKQVKATPFITQIFLRIGEDRTATAEFFILLSLVALVGIYRLYKKKYLALFWYSLFLFLPIPTLIQVDFSRFFIPILPFAFLVAYEEFFDSKIFKFLFLPLVILSLAYAIMAIPTNLFPKNSFLMLVEDIL
jgi:hypothetical protein